MVEHTPEKRGVVSSILTLGISFAEVAQLVEQPLRKRQVVGSIPILGFLYIQMLKKLALLIAPFLIIELFARVSYTGRKLPEYITPISFNPQQFSILLKTADESAHRDNALRILISGGSTAYGWGAASDEKRFPLQLQQFIDTSPTKTPVEIISGGIPDFEALDEYNFYLRFMRKTNPQVVVSLTGFNDIWGSLRFNLIANKEWRLNRFTMKRAVPLRETRQLFYMFLRSLAAWANDHFRKVSRAYLWLSDKMEEIDYQPISNLSDVSNEAIRFELDTFVDVLKGFHHTVTADHHRKFIVIIQPVRFLTSLSQQELTVGRYELKLRNTYLEFLKPKLNELTKSGQFTIYDLNETFSAELAKKNRFTDACHLNDEGNRELAEKVTEILRKEGIL